MVDIAHWMTVLPSLAGVTYLTDRRGILVAINPVPWHAFATQNESSVLSDTRKLIGRPLEEFIAGETVRESYRTTLNDLANGTRNAASIPFRCDSPDVRREMQLLITRVRENGEVTGFLFQSILIHEQIRPRMKLFKAGHRDPSAPLLSICSYCLNLRWKGAPADEWITPEVYYQRGGSEEVVLSHGVCPSCYTTALGRLAPQAAA